MRILAIDDINDNLTSLKATIQDAFPDSVVDIALNGQQGIQLALAHDPDIVLLDVVMPGMDGFEVCRQLKHNDQLKDIPVVFLTALKNDSNNRIKALELGAEGFLSKPIDIVELTAMVNAMVKIKSASRLKLNEKDRLSKLVSERTHELEQSQRSTLQLLGDLETENQTRKQTEDDLQTALQQLQFHENNSPLGVVEFNNQYQITKWSNKAEDLFGWKAEEVLGKQLDKFRWVHEEDVARVGELMAAMLASDRTSNCHINRNYHKDGSVITCEWYNSALVDSDGKLISVHSFVLDVTERIQQEAELIEAKEKAEESDRLKTSFLANMSHEIRTPLNSIIGFSELLTDPDYDSSQQFQIARMIYFSGNNLLAIINNILEISEIEAGQVHLSKEMFSINQLISNIQKEYLFKSIEKGIELYVEPSHPKKEVFMEGDELKTRGILSRFVNNALKFTKEGSITLGFKTNGDFVQFSVKDTGIGISEEYHDKIFERFRQVESANTRKYGGNGLGLAISKGLVELMGGTIWMESQKGMGSTFYFKIPLR